MKNMLFEPSLNQPDKHIFLKNEYLLCRSGNINEIHHVVSKHLTHFSSFTRDINNAEPGEVFGCAGELGVLLIIFYGKKVKITPHIDHEHLVVSTTLSGSANLVCGDKIYLANEGETFIYAPSPDVKLELNADCRRVVFCMNKEVLYEFCKINLGHNVIPHNFPLLPLVCSPSTNTLWFRLMESLSYSMNVDPLQEIKYYLQKQAEEAVIIYLIISLGLNDNDRKSRRVLPKNLSRAIKFIEENMHSTPSLGDISRAACCSPRTLQRAFSKEFDQSPMQFMKKYRLQCVYSSLRKARSNETVTSIAFGYGFFHLGQFAMDYKKMFGEHPSYTLSGSRGR